ncbi:rCG44375, partial [Rattus norvegicus]
MCSRCFPSFSSISLSVSGLMWRSLIHFDLSFVQGDKH